MTAPAAATWSDAAIAILLDPLTCPACRDAALADGRCPACGADLATPAGAELWRASEVAAQALTAREEVRRRLRERAPVAPSPVDGGPAPVRHAAPERTASPSHGSTTVQSVLAVAGASLFAVAAVVFTFFTPDVTDHTVRSLATAVTTAVFLAAARKLAARGLRSSAEAVGALGLVFVALDVYAFAGWTPTGLSPWVFAGVGTLIAGALMLALAARWRIRAWVGVSLLALATVPIMLSLPAGGVGLAAGATAAMAAGIPLVALAGRLTRPFAASLTGEMRALTAMQLSAAALALAQAPHAGSGSPADTLTIAAVLCATISVVARLAAGQRAGDLWSFVVGAGATAGGALAAWAIGAHLPIHVTWATALAPTGAIAGFLVVSMAAPPRLRSRVTATRLGALCVGTVAVLPAFGVGLLASATTLTADLANPADTLWQEFVPAPIGLAAVAVGLGLHARVWRHRGDATTGDWSGALAAWFSAAAAMTAVVLPLPAEWMNTALGIGVAGGVAAAIRGMPRLSAATRVPLIVAGHAALAVAAVLSWRSPLVAVAAGPLVVCAVAALAATAPRRVRWAHVAVGYAYALAVLAAGLQLAGLAPIPVLTLTASAGALAAIATTFLHRIDVAAWWAVLAVTSVPFLLGVLQVVRERSGWTALSTGLIFLLALTLVVTRRPGLGRSLRGLCAAVLVPALAVVVVCLGAEVLSASASPVTLPVIAVIVAVSWTAATAGRAALVRRGMSPAEADLVRIAIEVSAVLTGAIAVGLALIREASGLGTAVIVLVILAVGAGIAASVTGRTAFWWVAGSAATGALWCVWGIAGIAVLEPYLLPPALAAAAVGGILTLRGRGGAALVSVGLALAVVPSLVLLAVEGGVWRFGGLLTGAALLVVAATRPTERLVALRVPALAVAITAAAAGPVQGARFGLALDPSPEAPLTFLVCLTVAGTGTLIAAAAGAVARRSAPPASARSRSRWLLGPAVLYVTAGVWSCIERDMTTIWLMWSLMIALLALLLATAWRLRSVHRTILPPVWFLFVLAFVTAVVAWSPRELRVEWFSLPLGLILLAAGAAHLAASPQPGRPSVDGWPAGWRGSWALLTPGLVTLMSASIAATFTDPLTWRAILVIVMALAAILVGARERLAAPFIMGVLVLPLENVSAFTVQIGRGIESMPWWITLAVVGAVLLIIAVSYERRAGEAEGLTARLRDLR